MQNLEELINTKVLSEFELIKFPCHLQSVQKIVKLVTESCTKEWRRERSFIKTTLVSRSTMTINLNIKQCPNASEES